MQLFQLKIEIYNNSFIIRLLVRNLP